MNLQLSAGPRLSKTPVGDATRQAIDSLGGYVYQLIITATAWANLSEDETLYIEVAEDFATLATGTLEAVQVKNTSASGSVTLRSKAVVDAIESFVFLVAENPGRKVRLHFLTTSEIGREREICDRPGGQAGLEYWEAVARGAPVEPLRSILDSSRFSETVRGFVAARTDDELREELIGRISWDCGAPPIEAARVALELRICAVASVRNGIPANDAKNAVGSVIERVLRTAIQANAEDRYLTSAQLTQLLEAHGQVTLTLPHATVAQLLSQSLATMASAPHAQTANPSLTSQSTGFLLSGQLPIPNLQVDRLVLVAAAKASLVSHGTVFLIGSSGVGKSSLARALARQRALDFLIVDFRRTDLGETIARLQITIGIAGNAEYAGVILDDIACLDDPRVRDLMGVLRGATLRNGKPLIISANLAPTAVTLGDLALGGDVVVEVGHLSEKETAEVVSLAGGDSAIWAMPIYLMSYAGHPLLVQALVRGQSAKRWTETPELVFEREGFVPASLSGERDSIRRRLADALPAPTMQLLFRMSMAAGELDRATILKLGDVNPRIDTPGLHLDQLSGSLVEARDRDMFRVSPIVQASGAAVLSADLKMEIHEAIATGLLARRVLSPEDAHTVFIHALIGELDWALFILSQSFLTASKKVLDQLSRSIITLHALRTDRPSYPRNPIVSMFLRMAQFKLVLHSGNRARAAECAAALLSEPALSSEIAEVADASLIGVLGLILPSLGSAGLVPEFVSLLVKYRERLAANAEFGEIYSAYQEGNLEAPETATSIIFYLGTSSIGSTVVLEKVFEDLNALDPELRKELIASVAPYPDRVSLFIDAAWATEQQSDTFDSESVASRFRRLARMAYSWGEMGLAARCFGAEAVMQDEYQHDATSALATLDTAERLIGVCSDLIRRRARILWRRGDHEAVVQIQRDVLPEALPGGVIESAFMLRESAISAAQIGNYSQAARWFLRAEEFVRSSPANGFDALAIGLGMDGCIAQFDAGERGEALRGYSDRLEQVADLDPRSSLQNDYVGRLARHGALWLKAHAESEEKIPADDRLIIPSGAFSNSEPSPTILGLPMGHLDSAWYLLAEAEVAIGIECGIRSALSRRLRGGPIAELEASLRQSIMDYSISRSDPKSFAMGFKEWLDAMHYLHERGLAGAPVFDLSNPARGEIAEHPLEQYLDDHTVDIVMHPMLAMAASLILGDDVAAINSLRTNLQECYGERFPGYAVLDSILDDSPGPRAPTLDAEISFRLGRVLCAYDLSPGDVWITALRLWELAEVSPFGERIREVLASWVRVRFKAIISDQSALLASPRLYVPMIEAELRVQRQPRAAIAALLLVAITAFGVNADSSYRTRLSDAIGAR